MRLILIRHGQTASNTQHLLDTAYPGAPLDEVGLTQAAGLVDRLAGEPIEAIMTSDLLRAQQTAAPLAAARGLAVIVHPGLREIAAGDYELSPVWQPYVEQLQSWQTDPTTRLPGGETGLEFVARYEGAIGQLTAKGYATAALVSHGAALRTWLMYRVHEVRTHHWVLANTATIVVGNSTGEWQIERWADNIID